MSGTRHADLVSATEKEWTWRDIAEQVKYQREPLQHSLLRLETNDLDKMAVEMFNSECGRFNRKLRYIIQSSSVARATHRPRRATR